MSTQFSRILSMTGTAVLKRRAAMINEDACQEMQDAINAIKREIRQVDNRIANLTDLSIQSTTSLIVGDGFDSRTWVKEMAEAGLDKRNLEIELGILEGIQEEYFTDLPETKESKKKTKEEVTE